MRRPALTLIRVAFWSKTFVCACHNASRSYTVPWCSFESQVQHKCKRPPVCFIFFFSILSKLKMASSFAYSAESQTDRVNCTLINNSSLRQYQNNRISYICVLYYRVASLIIIVSTIICTLIYVVFVDITLLVLTSLSSTLSHT
jgi:hypothetical protein